MRGRGEKRQGPPAYGRAPAKAGEMNKKRLMSPVNRKFEFGIKYEEEGRRGGKRGHRPTAECPPKPER